MDIQRQEPEQIKVQLILSGQDIAELTDEISRNKKYMNMPTLQTIVDGIIGRGFIPRRQLKSLMNGKRYKRINKDHLGIALGFLKKNKKVSPWDLQKNRLMGWKYAQRSLESLVRTGQAQCQQRGKRKTYFYTGHLGSVFQDVRVEHEHKASYPSVLKARVNSSVQANGLMYMRDIAKSIRMSIEERPQLREILDELISEGKIKNIHQEGGGHPRYAPIDMRIPQK